AHAGQVDKAGEPYILHPLRVMLKLTSDEERIVGVLHDVVEDTDWTIERLRAESFSEQVLRAIQSVTHRDGEPYDEFVRRAAMDPIGRRVKIADLDDNLDLSRITNVTDRDRARAEKYRTALQILLQDGD
ncbi:MAG TPA: HD domain-containing protein, partial [Thermoanaerobaculia bacterium]|nr:HD domain-containing protein [Thermoanaerobaculia bacterium]